MNALRAVIYRAHTDVGCTDSCCSLPWSVVVNYFGTDGYRIAAGTNAPSWPEAMQQAYKLIRDVDRQLMEPIHAERAARRKRIPTPEHTDELTRLIFALLDINPGRLRDDTIAGLTHALKDPLLRRDEAASLIRAGSTVLANFERMAAA